VLVPTDFSTRSRAAIEYAACLVDQLGSSLEILHVWEGRPYVVAALFEESGRASGDQGAAEFVRTRNGRELAALLLALRERGVQVQARLAPGHASAAIVKAAKQGHHDLIVMGTHGRHGLRHLLFGSVDESVVRDAPCPVLTVKSGRTSKAEVVTGTA